MIRPIGQYCKDEVWPRIGQILFSFDTLLSLALGVWLGLMRDASRIASLRPADVATMGLTYSTIALGFSLAGLTIALTLPDRRFVRRLALRQIRGCNSFSNLLFVFSWTAFVHWILVVWSMILIIVMGSSSALITDQTDSGIRVVLGVFGALFGYGVSQFVSALLALSAVGRLYIEDLRTDDKPE